MHLGIKRLVTSILDCGALYNRVDCVKATGYCETIMKHAESGGLDASLTPSSSSTSSMITIADIAQRLSGVNFPTGR
jgi:hypothetical protein